MGYTSDIGIVLGKEVIADSILKNNLPEILLRDFESKEDRETLSGELIAVYYLLTNVKWYEGYLDVDDCMKFLATLNNDHYGYVRVGEDNGDIDIKGAPYNYDMYPHTYINMPISGLT